MQEGMVGLLQQLAVLKAAPDADIDAISGLEAQILGIVKQPQRDAMEKIAAAGGVVPGLTPPSGPGGGMSPGGSPMGGPAPVGMGMGGGIPTSPAGYRPSGMRNGGAMPPVDELRRLIASSGVA